VSAYVDLGESAVVLILAVILALSNGAADALVCLVH